MVLVSLWATYDIEFSLPKITGVLLGIALFFTVVDYSRTIESWLHCWILYGLAGLGITFLGLVGTAWPSGKIALLDRINVKMISLLKGFPGAQEGFHPNEIAGAMLWFLPALIVSGLFFILEQDDRIASILPGFFHRLSWILGLKVLWSFYAWFCLGVFALTQSRSGYLGLIISLGLLGWLMLKGRWKLYSVGLLSIMILLIFNSFRSEITQKLLFNQSIIDDPALSIDTLEGRVEIWSRAIYGIQDFPFTGMGMNTFRRVVRVLYPLFLIGPDSDIGHAHNEFLQAALDLGLPGLIAFIAINLSSFWMIIDLWQNRDRFKGKIDSRLTNGIILGCGASLGAHFIYGITDAVALGAKPGFIFWLLIGLITSLNLLSQSSLASLPSDR